MSKEDEAGILEDEAARVKRDEIVGIAFFTIAILLLVGWRFDQAGPFHNLAMGLLASIGAGMWYLILMFALWGIKKFRGRAVISDWLQLSSWAALLPVFLGFLQSFQPANSDLGGAIGWSVYTHLESWSGTFSARILLAGAFLILTVVCLDTPLTRMVATGLDAGSKATGILGPMVVIPVSFLYSVVYNLLCYMHIIVFVLLKDLVIVIEILLEKVMTVEQRDPVPVVVAAGHAQTAAPAPAEPFHKVEPIVEIDRPAAPPAPREDQSVRTPDAPAAAPADTAVQAPASPYALFLRKGVAEDLGPDAPGVEEDVAETDEDFEPTPEELQHAEDVRRVLRGGPEPEPVPVPLAVVRTSVPAATELDPAATAPPRPAELDGAPPAVSAESETPADATPALDPDLSVTTFPAEQPPAAPVVPTAKRPAILISSAGSKEYRRPGEELFQDPPVVSDREDESSLRANAEKLVDALAQFRIQASVSRITQGPTVTQYEVKPAPGVKISNIVNLSNDIAMALATPAIRIEAPIPGRSAVGIEIPNRRPIPVTFKEIITHDTFRRHESPLAFAIGKEITGKPIVGDLTRMPHLLVAGATGSGKSVCINTILSSLLFRSTPEEVKFILIDPKVVELTLYDGIPNLVTEVITDPADATAALRWAVLEMERRYRYLSKFAARDIRSFNRRLAAGDLKSLDSQTPAPEVPMPYIVIVIDELADLMMLARKEIEDTITRLAQMARAIGIHLVLATQRPSTNIITGVLKANLPSRIAFSVSSQVDSKVILDGAGAEKLLGSGDMLYSPIGQAKPIRLQGAYISEDEVRNLVSHLKSCGDPDYSNIVEEVMEPEAELAGDGMLDDKFAECVRIAIDNQEASTSMLQRHLKIGYNRAARIIEAMQARGIVSGPESGKRRKLLMSPGEAQRYLAADR